MYRNSHKPPSYKTPTETRTKRRWPFLSSISSSLGRLGPNPSISTRLDEESSYSHSNRSNRSLANATEMSASTTNVNRNTSVRSILTLPAYNPSPAPDERLVAREGERAGVDTVIEYPETVDEEESRREEEMDALYNIRQARRREIEERDERRRQRQEARDQGDWARLEQLRLDAQRRARERADSGASAASSTISLPQATSSRELIAEHAARAASRERRISSVSYAELGLARHDGTRLRAESVESDHRPLLENAGNISGNDPNRSREGSVEAPRRSSRFHLPVFRRHQRAASAESGLSGGTTDSETRNEVTPQTSSADASGSSSDQAIITPSGSGSGSDGSPPQGQPPEYNETEGLPPDYSSPVRDRGENLTRLPTVRVDTTLPVIEIVESTPTAGPDNSPQHWR